MMIFFLKPQQPSRLPAPFYGLLSSYFVDIKISPVSLQVWRKLGSPNWLPWGASSCSLELHSSSSFHLVVRGPNVMCFLQMLALGLARRLDFQSWLPYALYELSYGGEGPDGKLLEQTLLCCLLQRELSSTQLERNRPRTAWRVWDGHILLGPCSSPNLSDQSVRLDHTRRQWDIRKLIETAGDLLTLWRITAPFFPLPSSFYAN